jgi:hypothetical protein
MVGLFQHQMFEFSHGLIVIHRFPLPKIHPLPS